MLHEICRHYRWKNARRNERGIEDTLSMMYGELITSQRAWKRSIRFYVCETMSMKNADRTWNLCTRTRRISNSDFSRRLCLRQRKFSVKCKCTFPSTYVKFRALTFHEDFASDSIHERIILVIARSQML